MTAVTDVPVFFLGDEDRVAGSWSVAGGAVTMLSAVSPTRGAPNEDSAALFPVAERAAVLVVADGVGGERAGRQASNAAVRAVGEALRKAPADLPLRSAILDGMESANRAVLELGVGAATTLAVVAVEHDTIRPFHVGDSTILLVGQRGRVKLQTVAHSPVGFAVEAGMLDEADAMLHEERHLVSNLCGSHEMRIEIGPTVPMAPRDTLLIASDGLSDNLSIEEVIEAIRKGPLERAAVRLADESAARMRGAAHGSPSKPDDLTLIAFRRRYRRTASGPVAAGQTHDRV